MKRCLKIGDKRWLKHDWILSQNKKHQMCANCNLIIKATKKLLNSVKQWEKALKNIKYRR